MQNYLRFINLLTSLILQFLDPSENRVLKVISCRTDLKVFSEKLLLLVNREGKLVNYEELKLFLSILTILAEFEFVFHLHNIHIGTDFSSGYIFNIMFSRYILFKIF